MNPTNFQSEIEKYFLFLDNASEIKIFNQNLYNEVLIYYFQYFNMAFYKDYDKFQIQFITKKENSIDAIILVNYIESTKNFDYTTSQLATTINRLWEHIPPCFTESQIDKTIEETKTLKKIYQKTRWS